MGSIRSHFLPSLFAFSHLTIHPVSRIDFHEDGLCQTEHTLDIFLFSYTCFKNEEGSCYVVISCDQTSDELDGSCRTERTLDSPFSCTRIENKEGSCCVVVSRDPKVEELNAQVK